MELGLGGRARGSGETLRFPVMESGRSDRYGDLTVRGFVSDMPLWARAQPTHPATTAEKLVPAPPHEAQDMNHPAMVRVVYHYQPYLAVRRADGSLERAFGPFTAGTEPSVAESGPDDEVQDRAVLAKLQNLLPRSPSLPAHDDTLAGS